MKRAGERLDQFSQIVTRGGGLTADEAEQAASSPFLYTRVRARIESERKSRATPFADRFAMLPVAWRAIAALLIITLAAGAAFYASRRAATRSEERRVGKEGGVGAVAGEDSR